MAAREFFYVPMGERAPEGAAGCDGLVDGAEIDLSHWAKNHTPEEYKADTSVEIALSFVRANGVKGPQRVVNNHFDADGVLSVFTMLYPEEALAHAGLITAAAEAGDFDEWPEDVRGLWLNWAIKRLVALKPEASAYPTALSALVDLLGTIESREDLWGKPYQSLLAAEERAKHGDVKVFSVGSIAVFHHGPGVAEMPGHLLTRLLPPGSSRMLLAFEEPDGTFRYRYEMPRWSWADTVRRPVFRAPSRNALAVGIGEAWALKGEMGMVGLLRTTTPVKETPQEMSEFFLARERF